MKRMKNKAFLLLAAALALSLLLCGCMDRRENSPAGASGTEADAGTNGHGADADRKDGAGSVNDSETGGSVTDGVTDAETETKTSKETTEPKTKPETVAGADTDLPVEDEDHVISAEKEDAITEAYTKKYPQNGGIAWIAVYGEYNDAVALMIYGKNTSYTQALWSEEVDGVTFNYKDGNYIVVFDGSGFLRLSEAFENGLLTHDDLVAIASRMPRNNAPTEEK